MFLSAKAKFLIDDKSRYRQGDNCSNFSRGAVSLIHECEGYARASLHLGMYGLDRLVSPWEGRLKSEIRRLINKATGLIGEAPFSSLAHLLSVATYYYVPAAAASYYASFTTRVSLLALIKHLIKLVENRLSVFGRSTIYFWRVPMLLFEKSRKFEPRRQFSWDKMSAEDSC